MRVYLIDVSDVRIYIDLDHILAVMPPSLSDHHVATMRIVMAFKDEPMCISIYSETGLIEKKVIPKLVDGVPDGVHKLTPVFNDLVMAWCGKHPKDIEKEAKS